MFVCSTGRDRDGKFAIGDVRAQTQQTLDNIRALIEEAGGTMKDVVKCTVYVTDRANWEPMNEVYFAAFTLQEGIMTPLCEEAVLSPEEACAKAMALMAAEPGVWFAAGTGFGAYQQAFASLQSLVMMASEALPWAQDMLVLAAHALQSGETCDADQATPVYLRDKVTWKKLPGRE